MVLSQGNVLASGGLQPNGPQHVERLMAAAGSRRLEIEAISVNEPHFREGRRQPDDQVARIIIGDDDLSAGGSSWSRSDSRQDARSCVLPETSVTTTDSLGIGLPLLI